MRMKIEVREVYTRTYFVEADTPTEAKKEALLMNQHSNKVGEVMTKNDFAGAYAVSKNLDTMGWE